MRYYIVDAFTDQPFGGNPAGVVLLDGNSFPSETLMLQIAAEGILGMGVPWRLWRMGNRMCKFLRTSNPSAWFSLLPFPVLLRRYSLQA